jgi:hypothetical protein
LWAKWYLSYAPETKIVLLKFLIIKITNSMNRLDDFLEELSNSNLAS